MIRGFLFDLDGTLIDTERESGEALVRAMSAGQGIELEQYDRDYVIGRSWVAIYASLKERYPQMTWNRDETIAQTAIAREKVLEEHGVRILPGAREFLAATRLYPRALVTGSSRVEVTQVLPLMGEHARFDAIFAAEDVARSKPDPDGYQRAMATLNLGPRHCVVFEDSVAGIAAGRSAGCLVVAVRAGNFGGWDQSGAHHILDTLEHVTPTLVDQLARDYGFGMGSEP